MNKKTDLLKNKRQICSKWWQWFDNHR